MNPIIGSQSRNTAQILLLSLLGWGLSVTFAQALDLISVANPEFGAVTAGNGDSGAAILTPDGRYVLFASTAENLVSIGTNHSIPPRLWRPLNVYLWDRVTRTTTLVSVDLSGLAGGDASSVPRGLSANGQYALFESKASNLVPGDTNNAADVFVRDLVHASTVLASVNTNGVPGNGASSSPVLSPDGRYVAFVSAANDLVLGGTNCFQNVFVRDLQTGITKFVSVGLDKCEAPVMTPDGRFVAFSKGETNGPAGASTMNEVYVRDLAGCTTIWASADAQPIVAANLGSTNVFTFNHTLSEDGRFLLYEASPSSWASAGVVLRYELATGATICLHTNAAGPTIAIGTLDMTPDGNRVVFVANALVNSARSTSILLWDAELGRTTLVSGGLTSAMPEFPTATAPAIDAAGRRVAFLSSDPGLVTNDVAQGYHLYIRELQSAATVLVDVDSNGYGVGVGFGEFPSMSADGRFVTFGAPDGALVAGDRNGFDDLFIQDLVGGRTELVSCSDPGLLSATQNGVARLSPGSVSADGALVAFRSQATDFMALGSNAGLNVYVRDVRCETNDLININTNRLPGDGPSTDPSISGDGRYVAFTSSAGDLVPGITTNAHNVFLRDREARTTTLVSVNLSGEGGADAGCLSPVISTNGRFVVFNSAAGNLAPGGSPRGTVRLYVRDLQANKTWCPSTYRSFETSMTPDGRFVAFTAATPSYQSYPNYMFVWDSVARKHVFTNGSAGGGPYSGPIAISPDGRRVAYNISRQLCVLDRLSNSTLTVETVAAQLGLRFSGDGRFLTYVTMGTNGPSAKQLFVYDFDQGTKALVSRNCLSGAPGNGDSDSPDISVDGRFIAYRSAASDLVPGDNNGVPDIFVFDRLSGSTTLLTASHFGNRSANNRSANPVFSADGKVLFFESWASDLLEHDFNSRGDIFAYNIVSSSELVVFQAVMVPMANGMGITWPVQPGKSYRVLFKEHLSDPNWQELSGVSIVGNQGFLKEAGAAAQRFFRVVGF